jgi:2-polyprenyl-3-methyl-5-hydroxy-6-metoxy-1,4-benzoquinol methylase
MRRFPKRWPTVYSAAKKIRRSLVSASSCLKVGLFETSLQENEWRTKHLRKESDWGKIRDAGEEWVIGYWNSGDHTHRPFLIERIARYTPIHGILEVGSNCGPNLYLLAKRFPKTRIVGIDINPVAVKKGNELFAQEGIANVRYLEARADQIQDFPDKSYDVVFTDAVLMHIGPDKIRGVMKEMLRISGKALLLLEWHSGPDKKDPRGLGRLHGR